MYGATSKTKAKWMIVATQSVIKYSKKSWKFYPRGVNHFYKWLIYISVSVVTDINIQWQSCSLHIGNHTVQVSQIILVSVNYAEINKFQALSITLCSFRAVCVASYFLVTQSVCYMFAEFFFCTAMTDVHGQKRNG
jgi:hypothetical protein